MKHKDAPPHYPLEWSNVYVPIVPTALVDYLDSPTPFIMGLNARIAWDPVTAPDVTIDIEFGSERGAQQDKHLKLD